MKNLGTCYNTPGSFHCKCPAGMEGTGRRSVGVKVEEDTQEENTQSNTESEDGQAGTEAETGENDQTGGTDSGTENSEAGVATNSTVEGTESQVGQISDDDLFEGTGIGRRRRAVKAVDTGCTDLGCGTDLNTKYSTPNNPKSSLSCLKYPL